MAQPIIFNDETENAMFAVLRFYNYEYQYRKDAMSIWTNIGRIDCIDKFQEYIKENTIESRVITQCECTHKVSNAEIIFNTCETCKGVIQPEFSTKTLRRIGYVGH